MPLPYGLDDLVIARLVRRVLSGGRDPLDCFPPPAGMAPLIGAIADLVLYLALFALIYVLIFRALLLIESAARFLASRLCRWRG